MRSVSRDGIALALGFSLAAAGAVEAQRGPLDSALRTLAYPFALGDGRLDGPGAGLLLRAAEGSHCVALGEEHNTRAIPVFTTALFQALRERYGFRYLALEEGPQLGVLLSVAARRGGADSVLALGERWPSAFHMFTEEELQMIGEIGRASDATDDQVWGLNQEFGAAHVFSRLVEIAPNEHARAVAQELLERSLEFERERFQRRSHYLVAVARPQDFQRLRAAFAPAVGTEAARLIDRTALSNRIYAPYAAQPTPPSEAFYESGSARETNMKRLFIERYRSAMARDGSPPHVLVKSGHLHLYRGLSPRVELYTLGNFLSELAVAYGGRSLHLYVIVDRPYVRSGMLAPFASAAEGLGGSGVVFDLRPLFVWARRNRDIDPEQRRLMMSYDAVVFLRDGAPGSVERFRTPNFHWYPDDD